MNLKVKKYINKILKFLGFFGFNPVVLFFNLKGLIWFVPNYFTLKRQLKDNKDFRIKNLYPIMIERYLDSGSIKTHYFWQDFLIARKIFINKPQKHVDVGSRIDGFVTHIASFRSIEVFDIRPMNHVIDNVEFKQVDFSKEPFGYDSYTDSLSCLHVIEHFGLGRYGDPIDSDGHLKGLNNMYRILKKGGKFYFSTPIGPQRIEFNAHRVFSIQYLINYFTENFIIDSFSFVDDKGYLHDNMELTAYNIENNFNCFYGCGIFELTKK